MDARMRCGRKILPLEVNVNGELVALDGKIILDNPDFFIKSMAGCLVEFG